MLLHWPSCAFVLTKVGTCDIMTPTFLIFCGKTTETNWNDTKTALSGEELSLHAGTRRGGYGRKAGYMEGGLMDYSGELLKRTGDEAPLIWERERHKIGRAHV